MLAHLGSRYLDVAITREDHRCASCNARTVALLVILDEQRWAPRNFVVLNLRTAHLPYAQKLSPRAHPGALAG